MAEPVIRFEQLPPDAVAIAGGKGASLGRMTAAGLAVPPGFVVPADAFRTFLEACGGVEQIADRVRGLDVDDAEALGRTSAAIQGLIRSAPLPESLAAAIRAALEELQPHQDVPLVAVRSSAVSEDGSEASFAGQQETYLNVSGADAVLQRVKECWASFFSSRALFYRARKGVLGDTRMAVVVQEMVAADTSGVMFTVDPIRNRRHCMVIEAAHGLGEAIVSGEVTPDHYVISRRDGAIVDTFIPDSERAPVLIDGDLHRLWQMGLRLEDFFASPQDVEWCIRGGDLLLLQSRPITTLGAHG